MSAHQGTGIGAIDPSDQRVIHGPWRSTSRVADEPLAAAAVPPMMAALSPSQRLAEYWVQPLSVVLLSLAFAWMIFGGAQSNPDDMTQTAAVNPYNGPIWLGLLAASVPIMRQRWRELAAVISANWFLLALFLYFAVSYFWALDPPASIRRTMSSLVQFTLLATLVCGIRRAPVLHVTIAVVLIFAAIADLASAAIVPSLAFTREGFAGLQGQKNQTGLTMMYGCLAVAPCLAYARHWFWKCCLIAGLLVLFGVLIATESTTSQGVVIGGAILVPLLLRISRLPRYTIMAIAALFVLSILLAFFSYLAWCGVTGTDEWAPLDGVTFTNRLSIWQFVADEIGKRPWFGAGYSSFWGIDPTVQPSLQTDEWFSIYAIITEGHQGYLDLWATTGIFGLVAGLYLVFRSIGQAGGALNRTRPPALAWHEGVMGRPTAIFHFSFLIGLLVHNFTESGLWGSGTLLTAAMLIAMLDLEKWRVTTQKGRV